MDHVDTTLHFRIILSQNGLEYSLADRSAGEQWFFAFLYQVFLHSRNYDALKPVIFLMDEPSLYLHPTAQALTIRNINRYLKNHPEHYFLYSTHSPYLVDTRDPASIIIVSKPDGESSVLRPFYLPQLKNFRFSWECALALFARTVLLVEGQTESRALPVWGDYLGFSFEERSIQILESRNKGDIAKYVQLFSANAIPYKVLVDADCGKLVAKKENLKLQELVGCSNHLEYPEGIVGPDSQLFFFKSNYEDDLARDSRYKEISDGCQNSHGKPAVALEAAQIYVNGQFEAPARITEVFNWLKSGRQEQIDGL
jgi:hypothetical protein